jgi:hypothetical protein
MGERQGPADFTKALRSRADAFGRVIGGEFSVLMSVPPIYLGGSVDVAVFDRGRRGTLYVTHGFTGGWGSGQLQNTLGEYELVIATREARVSRGHGTVVDRQPPSAHFLLQSVGAVSLQRRLDIGDTIGPLDKSWHPLESILLVEYPRSQDAMVVCGARCGLVLCIGITEQEREYCHSNGAAKLIDRLRDAGVYPYTAAGRDSVIS